MKKLKRTPNIYSILRPTILYSYLFFMPSFQDNRKILLFSAIFSAGICIASISASVYNIKLMFSWMNICNFSHVFWVYVLTASTLTTYITYYSFFKDINIQMSRLNIILTKLHSPLTKNLVFICQLPLLLTIGTYVTIYSVEFCKDSYGEVEMWEITCAYLDFACLLPEVQYAGILVAIQYLFERLNSAIQSNHEIFVKEISMMTSRIEIDKEEVNFLSMLNQIFEMHSKLCDISESVSFAHSFSFLSSLVQKFMCVIHVTYYMYVRLMSGEVACDSASELSHYLWLLQQVLMMTGFVYITDSSAQQVCVLQVINITRVGD